MTDTIYINEFLRVRDFDERHYVVEFADSALNGEAPDRRDWCLAKCCESPADAYKEVMRYLGAEAARNAVLDFTTSSASSDILDMPRKTRK